MRTTYGRERKAYEYLKERNNTVFLPTVTIEKEVNGKKKKVEVSRIPNMLFFHGTQDQAEEYAIHTPELSYLRLGYEYEGHGINARKRPMIVPDRQLRTFQIICGASATNTIITHEKIAKFNEGQMVRVVEGEFAGAEGFVARFRGQQRVGIVINNWFTIATAYVPSAFLEIVNT